MATKWKNKYIVGLWAILLTFGLSGIVITFSLGGNYVQRNYFHTPAFQGKLDEFVSYLNMFVLNDLPLEEAKQQLKVTEDEIVNYWMNQGGITVQSDSLAGNYQFYISDAPPDGHEEVGVYPNAEMEAFARTELLREKQRQLEEYYQQREVLRSHYVKFHDQFQYYFTSSVSDKFHTNMSSVNAKAAEMEMNAQSLQYRTRYYVPNDVYLMTFNAVHGELKGKYIPFQGEIAVSSDLAPGSNLMVEYNRYRQGQILVWSYVFAAMAALIICGLKLNKKVLLMGSGNKWGMHYNKLPVDLRIILMFLSSIGAVSLLFFMKGTFVSLYHSYFAGVWTFVVDMLTGLLLASLLVLITSIQGKYVVEALTKGQSLRQEWERSLLYRTGQRIKLWSREVKMGLTNAFLKKSVGMQFVSLVLMVFTWGVLTVIIVFYPVMIFLYALWLAVAIPVAWFLIKQIGYFNQIVIKTEELTRGDISQELSVKGKSVLAGMAANMNLLTQAAKSWQNEQVKSERLKTELITNVSHDLRTPLTSIITYTELLKKEDITREERQAYVNIIDQKSQRLKVLINDLFEISKMASGNVEVVKEKVDLIQLLQQALAEYSDSIAESSLHFRFSNDSGPVYASVDGQKLWRVFDNLIGNVLKYSLEHSRVYISVQELGNQAIISFKNVTKYELSGDMDELLERFKRGDSSRHTEGSGLGLAIARSIVELHGGKFDINVEGDLFKVDIILS